MLWKGHDHDRTPLAVIGVVVQLRDEQRRDLGDRPLDCGECAGVVGDEPTERVAQRCLRRVDVVQ